MSSKVEKIGLYVHLNKLPSDIGGVQSDILNTKLVEVLKILHDYKVTVYYTDLEDIKSSQLVK